MIVRQLEMPQQQRQGTNGHRLTLGTRILIGVLTGIAGGVFLGSWSTPFQVAGDVYLGLLQMTVLPYVVVSLAGVLI
jgi:Na+/H+-dicarboxylate symporter